MYAIRRNLGQVNKGFLQIHELESRSKIAIGSKDILVDPSKHKIVMNNCYLHNSSARAGKIFSGEIYKERCAWITCESFSILPLTSEEGDEITYNPRVNPFFAINGINVDKQTFKILTTSGTKIIVITK